jgi:EAL domain-containing protein (putative c-di-GMP-specific phosphodiesterase class I)
LPEGSLLDRILAPNALSAAFQPVVDVVGQCPKTHYLEALIRGPRGTSAHSPDILFEYARRRRQTAAVDRACLRAILADTRALPRDTTLGLNAHASTVGAPDFVDFLAATALGQGVHPSRLVVEIVEHAPPRDAVAFQKGLEGLRDIGAAVALDDVGFGHSNYRMILESRPDYFKIDAYFVTGARDDYYRRVVLGSVARLARSFGARVVAEGVETEDDLAVVRDEGIDLVQGWLVAAAAPARELFPPPPALSSGTAAP